MAFRLILSNLGKINQDIFNRTREIASGKKLHQPGQDPAASARVVRIRSELSRINQYERNLQRSQVLLGSADQAFNTLRNILDTAIERTGFALGGIANQGSLDTIATEIDQIQQSVLRLANTSVDGRNIFSGTQTQTQPFQLVAGTYVYQGDAQPLQVEIARGKTIQLTVSGDTVFTEPSTDLLNSLTQLADALRAGDLTTAEAMMVRLADSGGVIDTARVQLSESMKQVDSVGQELANSMLTLIQELSSLEDADLAESIIALTGAETRLQAALQVGARQRASLFDLIG